MKDIKVLIGAILTSAGLLSGFWIHDVYGPNAKTLANQASQIRELKGQIDRAIRTANEWNTLSLEWEDQANTWKATAKRLEATTKMNADSARSCLRSVEALRPLSGRPIPLVPCDRDRLGTYWIENQQTFMCVEWGDNQKHDYRWTLERK